MSIQKDIERGLEIRKQLKQLNAELKDIETRLEEFGLLNPGEHVELKDADREGRQWLAQGLVHVVPVIFTADKLVQSFLANSAQHQTIKLPARGKLGDFYEAVTVYKNKFDDGKKFRAAADQILGPVLAPPFVTACVARDKHGVPKSDVKILWDDATAK
jgi:hypothetical protein